jgi:hypothetical protein
MCGRRDDFPTSRDLLYAREHARVSLSTLTITVHEKAPIVSSNPDENVLGTALAQSWRNFVYFLATVIASIGWLVPSGGIVVAGTLLVRRVLRGRSAAIASIAPRQA